MLVSILSSHLSTTTNMRTHDKAHGAISFMSRNTFGNDPFATSKRAMDRAQSTVELHMVSQVMGLETLLETTSGTLDGSHGAQVASMLEACGKENVRAAPTTSDPALGAVQF